MGRWQGSWSLAARQRQEWRPSGHGRLVQTPPACDGLGLSIDGDLLETKALRVMKIARSALIQLALAIGVEERAKARAEPGASVGSMPLFGLDDRRKRRDPC